MQIRWRFIQAMLIALPWQGAPTPQSGEADPSARAARLSYVAGEVTFQPSGSSDWSLATLNYSLTSGDRLLADGGARAELEVGSLSARLTEGADVTISTLDDHFTQLGLSQGTLRVSVYQMLPEDSVEVDTPNGAITIMTAGKYRIDVLPNDRGTLVRTDEGTVEVSGPGISQQLRAPSTVQLTGVDPIQLSNVARSGPDGFDQFSADRDRRVATATSSQYVSRDMPGVADLDQNGRWETDVVYGPVWYPARMPLGWAPYRFGHWVWIEPWGWTWVDDAPWGFAPFHYGRWLHARAGWGWVPGPIVPRPWFAPALVTFVDGSGFSVGIGMQAWFPLGPREPYFPWYHYGDRYLHRVNATNLRGVADIDAVIRRRGTIDYTNRATGFTAVSGEVFRGGQPVGRQAVHVRPEEIGRAPVTPHPSVGPDARAAAGGRPTARPHVIPRRPIIRASEVPPRPQPGSGVRQPAPRSGGGEQRAAPPQRGGAGEARPLIVRHVPAQENPSFPARQGAMQAHPGRPLEPQQMDNVRAGRPAGPPRDREMPAHPTPPPAKAQPKPQPKPQPKSPPRRP
ncbi:MAG: DUF6600 domain-containing protein [Gemmatimonadales bacterium]